MDGNHYYDSKNIRDANCTGTTMSNTTAATVTTAAIDEDDDVLMRMSDVLDEAPLQNPHGRHVKDAGNNINGCATTGEAMEIDTVTDKNNNFCGG